MYFILVFVPLLIAFLNWFLSPLLKNSQTGQVFAENKDYKIINPANNDTVVEISIVIPAYNEEKRMKVMIDAAVDYFKQWKNTRNKTFEIIIVDDGSTDRTIDMAIEYQKENLEFTRVVKLVRNLGKAGAVKIGVDVAIGKYILMVDADGATDIKDFDSLYLSLHGSSLENTKEKIAIGSRAHLAGKSIATRSLFRTVLMKGFHLLVTIFCTGKVADTQCGFKLFSSGAAKALFSNLHLFGWAFDIELIYMAERLRIPIVEIPVTWREVDGSKLIRNKLDIITTSLTMARDIICVWVAYTSGVWTLTQPRKALIVSYAREEL